jgi:hypothetical protein
VGIPPSRDGVVEIRLLDVANGSWSSLSARLKKSKLANLANLANISGTGRGAIFASGSSTGSERPEPLAVGGALLVR